MTWRGLAAPRYNRRRKRLLPMVRQILDEEQKKILEDPRQGERKRGALQDVWVWKFRAQNDQYLLAYLISEKDTSVIFLDIGQHENFYRDLERHLKTRVEDAS